MKNTFGTSITVTLFGESHGSAVGAVLDGLCPGIPVDPLQIAHQLSLRRPEGALSTARQEEDPFELVSGVYQGRTTGTPLCLLIPNREQHSDDYAKTQDLARPGHADYTGYIKYHGFQDPRGGGHFSGRITAALVAAGAIALTMLAQRGITLGTHISRLAGICDRSWGELSADLALLRRLRFPVLDEAAGKAMEEEILRARAEGDSVGGILESLVLGMPAGVGEPWFDTVEGVLSHALFSIPAVKGVEFGAGFGFADLRGSQANDPFRMEGQRIVTDGNHNGGVLGGITNGMPLTFRCVVKPTPSIALPQETVDFRQGINASLQIRGRHDPAILHRARVVVDSVTALVLCDLLSQRFGTDYFLPQGD